MKSILKCLLFLTFTILLFPFYSCKKQPDPIDSVIPKGVLYLSIYTGIDGSEIAANSIGTDANGRHFEMSLAQFYISNIVLTKSDGTVVPAKAIYLLKTIDNISYYVDSFPPATYVSIAFNVGIDAGTNIKTPSSFLATSPLYTQSPSMWFGNTMQGYIFMNVQGMADTSTSNGGTVNYPFELQLGGSAALEPVTLSGKSFTISSLAVQNIQLVADYGKLFQGISFSSMFNGIPTTSFTNPSLCNQVASNVSGMFRYK